MRNEVFGEMAFSIGWKTKREICLFGKQYTITVKLQASKAEDALPDVQQQACLRYGAQEQEYLKSMETLMQDFSAHAATRFTPRTLVFKKKGVCALLCDDAEDPDDGIAVCIIPQKKVMYQDDFL